jgi:hypothetical protein
VSEVLGMADKAVVLTCQVNTTMQHCWHGDVG